jgi:Prokaryotic membrane lipoprotein lipid attachment site
MKKSFVILTAALLLAGCASTEIDWNHQVGEINFDQAVSLLGPPDKTEKLDNGKFVAEWVSRFNGAAPTGSDDDFRYQSASANLNQAGKPAEESTLKLTFGTNDVLSAWSRK